MTKKVGEKLKELKALRKQNKIDDLNLNRFSERIKKLEKKLGHFVSFIVKKKLEEEFDEWELKRRGKP